MLLTLLGFTGFAATLASLPWWAVRSGVPQSTAGLVTTVMLGVTVVTQSFVPATERRLGAGRTLAIGLVALGAPSPLYLLSDDLVPMLVLSAVRGTGFAVLTVLGSMLTAVLAPRERHGEAVGVYGLAIAVPNLVIVPGAVALAQNVGFWPVAVMATLPVLAAPLALTIGGDHHPPADAENIGQRAAALAALTPSLVLLALTLAGGGVMTYLPIERPEGLVATLALLVLGLTSAFGRWRVGTLADRLGTRLLLPATVVVGAAGLVVLGTGLARGADGLLLAGSAVFGVAYGAVQNLTLVIAFAHAGAHGTSTASAVWNAAFDSGTGAGAVVVGALAATGMGVPAAIGVCAGLVVVTLPIGLRTATGRRHHVAADSVRPAGRPPRHGPA